MIQMVIKVILTGIVGGYAVTKSSISGFSHSQSVQTPSSLRQMTIPGSSQKFAMPWKYRYWTKKMVQLPSLWTRGRLLFVRRSLHPDILSASPYDVNDEPGTQPGISHPRLPPPGCAFERFVSTPTGSQ